MDIQTGPMHKFTKYLDSCWNLGKRKQLDSSWVECAWIVSQKDIDTSGCQAWFFLTPNTPNTSRLWDRTTLVLQLQGWDGWSGVCPKVFTGISVGYPLVQPFESKSTVGHGFPSKWYVLIDLRGQHYHPGIWWNTIILICADILLLRISWLKRILADSSPVSISQWCTELNPHQWKLWCPNPGPPPNWTMGLVLSSLTCGTSCRMICRSWRTFFSVLSCTPWVVQWVMVCTWVYPCSCFL